MNGEPPIEQNPRVAETVTHETAPNAERLPERIGRYHIKRVIAPGGNHTH